ncbi:MAG: hypothetical protein JXQ79_06780 [Rhodobacteraceae bacterium]|nr:hypothetical protein [Paracoccaceae bacterium]
MLLELDEELLDEFDDELLDELDEELLDELLLELEDEFDELLLFELEDEFDELLLLLLEPQRSSSSRCDAVRRSLFRKKNAFTSASCGATCVIPPSLNFAGPVACAPKGKRASSVAGSISLKTFMFISIRSGKVRSFHWDNAAWPKLFQIDRKKRS